MSGVTRMLQHYYEKLEDSLTPGEAARLSMKEAPK